MEKLKKNDVVMIIDECQRGTVVKVIRSKNWGWLLGTKYLVRNHNTKELIKYRSVDLKKK
jgi:hypothetical protein